MNTASDYASGKLVDLGAKTIDDINQLIDNLFDLLDKAVDEKEIAAIIKLLKALKQISDEDELEKSNSKNNLTPANILSTPSSRKTETFDPNPVVQKAKDYGEWAKQKFIEDNKPSKKRPRERLANTREFNGFSRDQLIEYYSPSKFYSLSSEQRRALFQATVNEYLDSNGVERCPVTLKNMPINKKSVYYGLYRPQYQEISINSNLFDNIDQLDNENNAYFPYQILSTLIHEATHHVQFQNLEDGADDEKSQLIKSSMMNDQDNMSYDEYLTEADELDARDSALAYIKEAALNATQNRLNLCVFYNLQKNDEMKNPKKAVSKEVKNMFPNIYDNTFMKTTVEKISNMKASQIEMNEIIHGRYISEQMQRRKKF